MERRHHTLTIHATAADVWHVLTTLDNYPCWNPLMRQARGTIAPGQTCRFFLRPRDCQTHLVTARVVACEPESILHLRSRTWVPGLEFWEHRFSIESCGQTCVKLTHTARTGGLRSMLRPKRITARYDDAFEGMDARLKIAAERRAYVRQLSNTADPSLGASSATAQRRAA